MSLAKTFLVVCALAVAPGRDFIGVAVSQTQEPPPPVAAPQSAQFPPDSPAPDKAATAAGKKSEKKATYAKKRTSERKRPLTKAGTPEGEEPSKRVVKNGSATDPATQISPSVPPQQASSQMQSTNSMLNTADANLKSLSGAQLNGNQEDMVKQVRNYMEQAKLAVGAGDLERASNLATKAQLLSAELVKK